MLGGFGDKELSLLAAIDKSKVPDVQNLSKLKIILSSANREMMAAFLNADVVGILVRMIRARSSRVRLQLGCCMFCFDQYFVDIVST